MFIGFKEPGARGGVDRSGRVLIASTSRDIAERQLIESGAVVERRFSMVPAVVARINPAQVASLRAHPRIDYVEPIFLGQRLSQDTAWNVRHVRAPESWASSTGSGVKLLIIDSGRPTNHPDFPSTTNIDCTGQNNINDTDGHGTTVAGIVAAVDNSEHIIGVAHGVQLLIAKDGDAAPDPVATLCALDWAYYQGVFAVNISSSFEPYTPFTDQVTSSYYWHGMVIVAAAGNTHGGPVVYPASLPEVIAVTAVDANNRRASFAAIGNEVELSAPGATVKTLRPSNVAPAGCDWAGNNFVTWCSGTSHAAPHVAAAAAILKAYRPVWSNVTVRDRLRLSAVPLGQATRYGYGLVDIRAAIDHVWELPPQNNDYSVTLSGPSEISPTAECYWSAGVTAGETTGPYTYQWHRDGQLVSVQDYYSGGMYGASAFQLSVTVTSAEGWPTSDALSVTNTGFGECFAI